LNPSYSGSFYCRQYYGYGTPSLGVEPVYPYWFPSVGYGSDQSAAPAAAEPSDQDVQLASEVGSLATEVAMLRQDQAMRDARNAPPGPPPPPEAEAKLPSTILVYRDGHQTEVENYAIQGKTLWVFSSQTTRQIPLTDLDVAATRRVNQERGVDFAAPAANTN
jgi:hypothetical protein